MKLNDLLIAFAKSVLLFLSGVSIFCIILLMATYTEAMQIVVVISILISLTLVFYVCEEKG